MSDEEELRRLADAPHDEFKVSIDPVTGEKLTDLRVDALYAYLVIDDRDNVEGIAAVFGADGWKPMVGADLDRMEMLEPAALALARRFSVKVTLARFTTREDLKVLG